MQKDHPWIVATQPASSKDKNRKNKSRPDGPVTERYRYASHSLDVT